MKPISSLGSRTRCVAPLRWGEHCLACAAGCFTGAGMLACAALASVGLPRGVALFLAALCLLVVAVWHVSLWLFGCEGAC